MEDRTILAMIESVISVTCIQTWYWAIGLEGEQAYGDHWQDK